jgi:homoprotocatechuate degradation regulator HpaR
MLIKLVNLSSNIVVPIFTQFQLAQSQFMQRNTSLVPRTTKQPKLRRTERSLPIALLRARETVMVPIREMLLRSNMTEQKWRVLRVLQEKGPQEQTAIADAACLLLPSLTRIVQSMQNDGFLTRATDIRDKRKSIVQITPAGQELILANSETSNAIFERLEAKFTKEKMECLLDLLDELQHLKL